MKRIIPNDIYRGLPCSVVAIGCAAGLTRRSAVKALVSNETRNDGYLTLNGMNALIRENLTVSRAIQYKRGERPLLREFAHQNEGKPAIVCVLGHYVYFDGHDYHSFYFNGGDEVVKAWYIEKENEHDKL